MTVNLSRRAKIVIVTVPVIIVASLIAIFAFYYMQNITAEAQITELYNKILKRDPDPAGLSYYRDQIIRDGKSLEWVEETLQNSEEATTLKIAELYRDILKREPDSVGLNYYAEQVTQYGKSLEWVKETLQNSEEARSIVKMKPFELGDETKKIIDDLYIEILHRPVDTKGLEYFGSMLESGKMSVEDIRKALLESDEYKAIN